MFMLTTLRAMSLLGIGYSMLLKYLKIYVNPDCGLRTMSRDVAISKLRSMVQGAMLARSALEGR